MSNPNQIIESNETQTIPTPTTLQSLTVQTETTTASLNNQQALNANKHCDVTSSTTSLNKFANEHQEEMARRARQLAKSNRRWRRRLWLMTCCFGYKRNKDTIVEVANLMTEFFADIDISVAELTTAFKLLREQQEVQRNWLLENKPNEYYAFLSNEPIGPNTQFLDISNPNDAHLLNELIYYLNYATAIFGWPVSMIDDKCFLCCIFPYLKVSCFNCFCCSGQNKKARRKVEQKTKHIEESVNHSQNSIQTVNIENSADNLNNKLNGIDVNNSIIISNDTVTNSKLRQTNANNSGISSSSSSSRNYNSNNCDSYNYSQKDIDTPYDDEIYEDNCCSCNIAAFRRRLRDHNYDIIYVSYHVDVNKVPFSVVADHSKRTIVISIRGSMSIYDAITDFNGAPVSLPIDNCPSDWLCHRGVALAALYIKQQLEEYSILNQAFSSRKELDSDKYNLIICGHSLGAGVASILGILLREKYPSLKAYLFAAPGAIVSLPVAEYTKEFSTAVFLGNDGIQRVGIAQFERLRYCALLCLKNADLSKRRIIASSFCPSICSRKSKHEYQPETSFDLLNCVEGETFVYNTSKVPFQTQKTMLYVPGKLIHIVRNYTFSSSSVKSPMTSRKCCFFRKEPLYQAIWVENKHFDRIMLADNMLADHLPHNLMHALKMVFCKTLAMTNKSQSAQRETNETINITCSSTSSSTQKNYNSIKEGNN